METFTYNCDFNKYRIFYTVAECSSFSEAADVLHISQPAISYAIKELESKLDTQLFIRSKTGIKLTDDGEKLCHYVQKAFNNIFKGEKSIMEHDDDNSGLIRIGIYSHISKLMLPKIIKKFQDIHPKAKFSIYQSANYDLKDKLKHKEVDFVVLQYPIYMNEDGVMEEIVCRIPTTFFATKEMYDMYKNGCDKYPLVLPFEGYADIDSMEERLRRHNVKFDIKAKSYDSLTAVALVKQNIGIGWGIKKFVEKDILNGKLYEVNIPIDSPLAEFSIAYNDKYLNNTAREFIKFFKEELPNIINNDDYNS